MEMEKVLQSMPTNQGIKAERILEINQSHDILSTLQKVQKEDKEKLAEYTNILYDQALLIEGMTIEDPIAFCKSVCKLMK